MGKLRKKQIHSENISGGRAMISLLQERVRFARL